MGATPNPGNEQIAWDGTGAVTETGTGAGDATTPKRARRERGAALVEAILIFPIVIGLVFGTIEMGYAYFGKLTVERMSVAGARSGSGEANDVLSDYYILQAISKASTGMASNDIKNVAIYRATGPTDRVPAACKAAGVTNTSTVRGCNHYTGSDFSLTSTSFGCVGPPGPTTKSDNYWCPTTRKTALTATYGHGPPDYVGVWVQVTHHNLTGLFGPTFTFEFDSVIEIEPRTVS